MELVQFTFPFPFEKIGLTQMTYEFYVCYLFVKNILDIKPKHFIIKHKRLKIFLSPQIKIET